MGGTILFAVEEREVQTISFIPSFIHSFNRYLLSTHHVSDRQARTTYSQSLWFSVFLYTVNKWQGCRPDPQSSTGELTCWRFSLRRIKIEEDYAKNLAKLSQNSLAAQEEG